MDRSEKFEKDTGFERSRGGRFFMQFKGKGRRSVNGWLICCWFFLISRRVIFLKHDSTNQTNSQKVREVNGRWYYF